MMPLQCQQYMNILEKKNVGRDETHEPCTARTERTKKRKRKKRRHKTNNVNGLFCLNVGIVLCCVTMDALMPLTFRWCTDCVRVLYGICAHISTCYEICIRMTVPTDCVFGMIL